MVWNVEIGVVNVMEGYFVIILMEFVLIIVLWEGKGINVIKVNKIIFN